MKVLLTGSTGFVGSEILSQCASSPWIHEVYVLTRQSLATQWSTNPKVHQILHTDWLEYPDHLLATLRDAGVTACIWAVGGTVKKLGGIEAAQRTNVQLAIHAAERLAGVLGPATLQASIEAKKTKPVKTTGDDVAVPFRFVYVSGWGAEQDPYRKLWMMGEDRKIKGATERGLFEIADSSREVEGQRCFQVIALRVGGVLAKGDKITTIVTQAVVPSCTVDRLARCAIRVALDGTNEPGKRILENAEILGPDWADVNSLSL